MRVLLTGGFGYLGGRLAQRLARTDHTEVVLGSRHPSCPPAWLPGARVVRTDWSSDRDLSQLCRELDAIVHLAGMNAADCALDPIGALEFNGLATARLVRAAVAQRVSRFIYISSAHVYGTALCGIVRDSTCPEPLHPYATSHRAGEDALRSASGEIDAIIVRLSNAFGVPASPCEHCWSLLINDLCRQAARTHRLVLKTDGSQRRDFIPISAFCRAIEHLLTLPAALIVGGVFNVGGQWAPTVLEAAGRVAEQAYRALGVRPAIVAGEKRDQVGTGPLQFSMERLLASGFEPELAAIDEELRQLINFCARTQVETS